MPFSESLAQFNGDYLRLTMLTAQSCENNDITDSMVIGTSAIIDTEIDGAVGMNSGIFNNPFIIWGRYHKSLLKQRLSCPSSSTTRRWTERTRENSCSFCRKTYIT